MARVYELAREIGWTTPDLKRWLNTIGEFVGSGADDLSEDVASRVRRLTPADKPRPLPPSTTYRWLAVADSGNTPLTAPRVPDSARIPDEPVTAAEATSTFLRGVRSSTVRQWASRGVVPVVGRKGRSNLYRPADLVAVRRAHERSEALRKARVRRELTSQDFDALVTVTEASRRTGLSRSTLSSWVRRGLLLPAGTAGKRRTYYLREVYARARQNDPGRWSFYKHYDTEEDDF